MRKISQKTVGREIMVLYAGGAHVCGRLSGIGVPLQFKSSCSADDTPFSLS